MSSRPAKPLETRDGTASPYVSPKELMFRWQCSRTSVDRIARRAGLTRIMLGAGKNGMVRYVRDEVETFEAARSLRSHA